MRMLHSECKLRTNEQYRNSTTRQNYNVMGFRATIENRLSAQTGENATAKRFDWFIQCSLKQTWSAADARFLHACDWILKLFFCASPTTLHTAFFHIVSRAVVGRYATGAIFAHTHTHAMRARFSPSLVANICDSCLRVRTFFVCVCVFFAASRVGLIEVHQHISTGRAGGPSINPQTTFVINWRHKIAYAH